jgi:splicing factor U2AF subunit
LLNAALSSLHPGEREDPIISAWISSDGHYAFVEFRSAEEANKGLDLDKLNIMGQVIKVGRPKTFQGNFGMMESNAICNTVGAALQAGTMNASQIGKKVIFPCRILCFERIVRDLDVIYINID